MKVVHITDRKAEAAHRAMWLAMQQADAYYALMQAKELRRALLPDSNVIPFRPRRARSFGGFNESA